MNITIIGAGNTALAAACHMASKGFPITVYARNEVKARFWSYQPVTATGKVDGIYPIFAVSSLKEAVEKADILVVATLATDHVKVAEELAPHLKEGQCLLFFNGCFGALQACRVLGEKREALHLTIGETANMPYIAALSSDWKTVAVKGLKEAVSFSAVGPGKDRIGTFLAGLYHKVEEVSSLAATSLGSTNPIIHVAGTLFNITRVDNGEDFFFFGPAMTKRAVAVMEKADAERLAVGRALGLYLPSLLDGLNSFWPEKWPTLFEALRNNKSYSVSKGPVSLTYRYLSEDLPCGLMATRDLGHLLSVPVPATDILIEAASLYLNEPVTPFLTAEDLAALRQLS